MRGGAGYMFLESGLFKETVFQEETEYENGLFFEERKKIVFCRYSPFWQLVVFHKLSL